MSKCKCEVVSVVNEVSMVHVNGGVCICKDKEEEGQTPLGESPSETDCLGIEPGRLPTEIMLVV